MKYLQLASVAAALSGSAMAFTVSLWNGPMCTSAEEGQYDISVAHAGSGCHTNGAGVAQSATIQMGDGDGSGDTIAFYTSDDCNPENAFAEGDSGCIDVTGDSQGAYGSFNAVGSGNEGRVKTRSANETAESEHPLKVEHGQVKYAFGGTYKWHQIAHDAWQGIPLKDWNDDIHIKQDHALDFDEHYPANFSDATLIQVRDLHTGELLEERSFNGQCKAVANCIITAGSYAHYGISDVKQKFLNAAGAAKAPAQSLWNFLNQPFITGITTASAGGMISGYVGSKTYNQPAVVNCSTAGTDADAISNALALALASTNNTSRDIQITITLSNGASGTLSMAAYPNGAATDKSQDQCGAPADKELKMF